jgi:tRNA G46 methylase TrmB
VNLAKTIVSNQEGLHPNLASVVTRHLGHPFLRPIPDFSQQAFEQADKRVQQHPGPIILDSFCGVGESTINIARAHPETLVIGLDKSLHRLNKHDHHYRQSGTDNYLLIRADTDDFWRLAQQAGWQVQKHFLLYPNPWPKSAHLQRRCHGSPLFPTLLALGGTLELRSNWQTYVEEFASALRLADQHANCQPHQPQTVITPFERKYLDAGQTLWRCICTLS